MGHFKSTFRLDFPLAAVYLFELLNQTLIKKGTIDYCACVNNHFFIVVKCQAC